MNYNIIGLILFLGLLSGLPPILVNHFYVKNKTNFTFWATLLLVLELALVYTIVCLGYFYFNTINFSMAYFFPLIKIIAILLPVLAAIFIYKSTKYSTKNYMGILLAIIAIVLIFSK
jgi:hypothetical protein